MTTNTNTPAAPAINSKALDAAANKLRLVEGDKAPASLWDFADAVAAARDPGHNRVGTAVASLIRQRAIAAAGHDDFRSVQRIKKLGDAAIVWPKQYRVDGVVPDAHMEALKHSKNSISDARNLIETIAKGKTNGRPTSIRDIRDAVGANGGTKAAKKAGPPRIDKATPEQFIAEMFLRGDKELAPHLRKVAAEYDGYIRKFHTMFADIVDVLDKMAAASSKQQPQSPTPAPKPKPVTKPAAAPVKKKGRIVGL